VRCWTHSWFISNAFSPRIEYRPDDTTTVLTQFMVTVFAFQTKNSTLCLVKTLCWVLEWLTLTTDPAAAVKPQRDVFLYSGVKGILVRHLGTVCHNSTEAVCVSVWTGFVNTFHKEVSSGKDYRNWIWEECVFSSLKDIYTLFLTFRFNSTKGAF
jgi:hypothetical protein